MNAVITGASKGLGLAIAEALAKEGHRLFINSRNETEIKAVASQLSSKYGVEVDGMVADLSKKEEVLAFGQHLLNKEEAIDILVNNAGIYLPGEVHKEEEGTLEKLIETNLYSAYYLTKVLMPAIFKAPQPHIFNMCSIASLDALPNGGSYSVSKFALLGYTKALRAELKERKIKVTAILPGATWSDSWKGVDLPRQRLMEAEDIAALVMACYKLSPAACVEEIVVRPQLGDL